MPIQVDNPTTVPARRFDRLHLHKYMINRSSKPPYVMQVILVVQEFEATTDENGNELRLFNPHGLYRTTLDDYKGWLKKRLEESTDPQEAVELFAFHNQQIALIVKLSELLFKVASTVVPEVG